MANEAEGQIKKPKSVGARSVRLPETTEVLEEAAQLGLLVAEYLFSDDGPDKTELEFAISTTATTLKEKLKSWHTARNG